MMKGSQFEFPHCILVCCADRAHGGIAACGSLGRELLFSIQENLDRLGEGANFHPIPTGCLGFCCEERGVVVDAATKRVRVGVQLDDVRELAQEVVDSRSSVVEEAVAEEGS